MGLSGGGDRSELRPLRPDGTLDHDVPDAHIVGNHKGEFGALNWANPRPGTVIQWATRRDVLACKQRGWWVAGPEDGAPAYMLVNHGDPVHPSQTTDTQYPDLVPMVTSEENLRRLHAENDRRAKELMSGNADADYLSNVPGDEFEGGRGSRGYRPTRWASKQHGTTLMEGDEVLEHLTPHGIVRDEEY